MAAYSELSLDSGGGDWWHPTGHLRWPDDPAGAEGLHAAVGHLRSWGYAVDFWYAGSVNRLIEPNVRFPTEETRIAFYRGEGWIDGPSLVHRFIDDLAKGGAEMPFGSEVTEYRATGAARCPDSSSPAGLIVSSTSQRRHRQRSHRLRQMGSESICIAD